MFSNTSETNSEDRFLQAKIVPDRSEQQDSHFFFESDTESHLPEKGEKDCSKGVCRLDWKPSQA